MGRVLISVAEFLSNNFESSGRTVLKGHLDMHMFARMHAYTRMHFGV